MKKLLIAVAATAVILPLCAADETAPAAADQDETTDCNLHAEVTLDLMSDYMFRGMTLNRNPVYQPTVELSYETDEYGKFSVSYWASLDFTHKRNSCWGGGNSRRCGSMAEQDFYLGYEKKFDMGDAGDVTFSVGHYWYDYPCNGKNHWAGTCQPELTASLSWDTGYMTPGVEAYWSYSNSHSHDPSEAYFRCFVNREFEIAAIEGLTITPEASVAFGDTAFVQMNAGVDNAHTELVDQTLSLGAEYEITKHLSVGAKINYTWIPSHTLRQARYMTCGQDNNNQLVWGGVSLKLKF